MAKAADAQRTRSPSKEKLGVGVTQSQKPGVEEGQGEDRLRPSKASGSRVRSPQTQTAAQRIAAQIAAAPRPLSRERSVRRAVATWESQLRSPCMSTACQETREEKETMLGEAPGETSPVLRKTREKATSVELPTGRFNRSNSLPALEVLELAPRSTNGLPSQTRSAQPFSARRTVGGRVSHSPPLSSHTVRQSRCISSSVAAPPAPADLQSETHVATQKGTNRTSNEDVPSPIAPLQLQSCKPGLVPEQAVASSHCSKGIDSPSPISPLQLQCCKTSLVSEKVAVSTHNSKGIDSPRVTQEMRTVRTLSDGIDSPRSKTRRPNVIRQSSLPFKMTANVSADRQDERRASIVNVSADKHEERRASIARQCSAKVDASEKQDKPVVVTSQVSCSIEKQSQQAIPMQLQDKPLEAHACSKEVRSPRLQQRESTESSNHRDNSPQAANATPRSRSPKFDDPYRLRRFTIAQKAVHAEAVAQIRAGRKTSGWMWFEIPTPPHIVKGVERGSSDNRKYALRSDEEVLAFLQFQADGVDLRKNFLELLTAVRDQLRSGRHPTSLMGKLSAPKLVSSVRLFERVARGGTDKELYAVLEELMELLLLDVCREV